MAEQEKRKKEKDAKENADKKKLEEEQMNQLEGRLVVILDQLQTNSTPLDLTVQGVDLGPIRCQMVAKNVAFNKSLLSLDMSRCSIEDNDGMFIARMLKTNKSLRKLDLEGNLLGPNTASAFGRALKENKTLKTLNLESNQL